MGETRFPPSTNAKLSFSSFLRVLVSLPLTSKHWLSDSLRWLFPRDSETVSNHWLALVWEVTKHPLENVINVSRHLIVYRLCRSSETRFATASHLPLRSESWGSPRRADRRATAGPCGWCGQSRRGWLRVSASQCVPEGTRWSDACGRRTGWSGGRSEPVGSGSTSCRVQRHVYARENASLAIHSAPHRSDVDWTDPQNMLVIYHVADWLKVTDIWIGREEFWYYLPLASVSEEYTPSSEWLLVQTRSSTVMSPRKFSFTHCNY